MVDRFDRLRHHTVIGCDDDDSDIRNTCTSGAHGRECFMARRIQESDQLVIDFYLIGTDMLSDTAEFTFNDT